MSKVFFTSDTHFSHKNIIKYCKRPFKDITEMNDVLIDNINSLVKPEDTLWHLGDVAFGNPYKFFDQLKCSNIHLILGNHDAKKTYVAFWAKSSNLRSVERYEEIKVNGKFICLFHYGQRVWNKSHHGAYQFYGHSHDTLPGNSQSIDVGVDSWDYKPVTLEQIEERLKTLPPYVFPDHHNTETNP